MPNPDDYTVGWICALSLEGVAACMFLDERHEDLDPVPNRDDNTYILGRIGAHNVVIATMPMGKYGNESAMATGRDLLRTFPNVKIGLMVGVGGGAPGADNDVRLGDVVVSAPRGGRPAVLYYDMHGRPVGEPVAPPQFMLDAALALAADHESSGGVHGIEAQVESVLSAAPRLRKKHGRPEPGSDVLFPTEYTHPGGPTPHGYRYSDESCDEGCDRSRAVTRPPRPPGKELVVHHGAVASGNLLVRDAEFRDKMVEEHGVICFEMEAAGLVGHFPCLAVRGICDYCDTHKSKGWQGYAAMAAAAYAKQLLGKIWARDVEAQKRLAEVLPGGQ